MDKKTAQQKYNEVKARLHTCSPTETKALKELFNYYYGVINGKGRID